MTAQLLRPNQVKEMKTEERRLEGMLSAPPYVAQHIEDRGEIQKQLKRLRMSLDQQAPQPIPTDQLDAVVAEERRLREEWLAGMPTQEEMRRAPAGAPDKHATWERRNKKKILRWKNARRRLQASGAYDEEMGRTGSDVANIELYRPSGGPQQLPMHGEMIPGAVQFGPTPGAGPAVVMTDEDKRALKELDPKLLLQMPLLTNDQRREVIALVREIGSPAPVKASDERPTLPVKPLKPPKVKRKYGGEMGALRTRAKELGINSFGKSKDRLREEIEHREPMGEVG